MIFPTSEPKIKRLCDRMVDGLFWHQADFPHVSRMTLNTKKGFYAMMRKAFVEAKAQRRIATKMKNEKLSELVKIMHNCLKKSEVDVAANPEKLKQIGWSPKDKPQPAQIPSQPLNLRIINKESGTIQLEWQRPADDTRIRNYVIECRQAGNQPSEWQAVGISYRTKATLTDQPGNVLLEYRIKAANLAGESLPSNVVSAILS